MDTGSNEPGLFEIISTTRAMRRLKPDAVPDELVVRILQAGVCAPSGGNAQGWRFLVIKDPEIKAVLEEGKRQGAFLEPHKYANNDPACEALRTVVRRLRELQAVRDKRD